MIAATELAFLRDFSGTGEHPVISLYFDIDGARLPRRSDFENELGILIRNARKAAAGRVELDRQQEKLLDADLQAISEYINLEFQRNGAQGLAIFYSSGQDLKKVIPLHTQTDNQLFVNWQPRIAPLARINSEHRHLCVLVTGKETARVFEARAGEIVERTDVSDSILKHHNQGGWEQNRLQRRHEKQAYEHLKNAAGVTLDFFRTRPFAGLVCGVADELWPELERALHPYLKEKLIGRFSVDVNDPANEILARVEAIELKLRREEEEELLASLGPELKAGRLHVGGLDAVLQCLNEKRVELLIAEDGFTAEGWYCHGCITLNAAGERCPVCGEKAEHVPDIIEEAREMAVRQDAGVMSVAPGHPAMKQAGGIAARLRY